jgi:NAD(P)-dependent dehydrogenase (short-subunit alcohol dehydrogenase family)
MDLELKGKRVLVTGASKGIGLAIAQGFAGEGANVILVSRTEADLLQAKAVIFQAHGMDPEIHALDLSDSGNIDALVERVGDIDILINNAGAIPGGNLLDIDEETWRQAWDLKVFGFINLTRHYLAKMIAQGAGVIVNVVGMAGDRPEYSYIAGSAGNASLMAFTKAVGSRSIDQGVRVLAASPGPVQTDRIITLLSGRAKAELGDADKWPELTKSMPLGRPAKPEECADLVLFLASARASYLSGLVVPIDGGLSSRGSLF